MSENLKDIMMRAVKIYGDGGCIKRNPSEFGITWSWCAIDKDNNRILERSGYIVRPEGKAELTNNHAEQIALLLGLEQVPFGWAGEVLSDSQCALGRLFWDWPTTNLPRNVVQRSIAAVKRLGDVRTVLLKGHPTKAELAVGWSEKRNLPVSEHNVYVDKLCKFQAKQYWLDLEN